MSEELIFSTLALRMAEVVWGSNSRFKTISRRVKLFSDVSVEDPPACFQAEHGTTEDQKSNMPQVTTLEASWIIYQCVGKDPNAIPAIENNLIMDAVRKALAPLPSDPGFLDRRNTLGGLVHHCFIGGRVFKDPGDIDDQGMMVIPIKLLVP